MLETGSGGRFTSYYIAPAAVAVSSGRVLTGEFGVVNLDRHLLEICL